MSEIDEVKKEIDEYEHLLEVMKAANKIVRNKKLSKEQKREELIKVGIAKGKVDEVLEPDYMGRVGFKEFELRSVRDKIKRLKEKLEKLEEKSMITKEKEVVVETPDYEIVKNYKLDRVMIYFKEVPNNEVRYYLKKNGFHWSPTNGAWMRKLTNAAIEDAIRVVDKFYYNVKKNVKIEIKDEITKEQVEKISRKLQREGFNIDLSRIIGMKLPNSVKNELITTIDYDRYFVVIWGNYADKGEQKVVQIRLTIFDSKDRVVHNITMTQDNYGEDYLAWENETDISKKWWVELIDVLDEITEDCTDYEDFAGKFGGRDVLPTLYKLKEFGFIYNKKNVYEKWCLTEAGYDFEMWAFRSGFYENMGGKVEEVEINVTPFKKLNADLDYWEERVKQSRMPDNEAKECLSDLKESTYELLPKIKDNWEYRYILARLEYITGMCHAWIEFWDCNKDIDCIKRVQEKMRELSNEYSKKMGELAKEKQGEVTLDKYQTEYHDERAEKFLKEKNEKIDYVRREYEKLEKEGGDWCKLAEYIDKEFKALADKLNGLGLPASERDKLSMLPDDFMEIYDKVWKHCLAHEMKEAKEHGEEVRSGFFQSKMDVIANLKGFDKDKYEIIGMNPDTCELDVKDKETGEEGKFYIKSIAGVYCTILRFVYNAKNTDEIKKIIEEYKQYFTPEILNEYEVGKEEKKEEDPRKKFYKKQFEWLLKKKASGTLTDEEKLLLAFLYHKGVDKW